MGLMNRLIQDQYNTIGYPPGDYHALSFIVSTFILATRLLSGKLEMYL